MTRIPHRPARRHASLFLLAAPACALAPAAGRAQGAVLSPQQADWVSANPVVHFAAIPDQRPISFVDRGRHAGMSAELLQRASEELGLSFRPVTVIGRDDAVARLVRGELDLIPVAGLSRFRPAPMLFTRPIMRMQFGLYEVAGVARAAPPGSADRKVGVPSGYEQLAASLGPSVVAVPVTSLEEAMGLMARGAMAGVAMPRLLADAWIARNPARGLRLARELPVVVPIAMAVRRDLPMLRDVLDVFLGSRTDAQRAALQATWFGAPPSQAWPLQAMLAPGAGVALCGAVALGWARRRRGRPSRER
jgi:two-component system sensor histidine kinase EvgS